MTCNRFEEEGLLLLEKGLPLGEHFATCPECLRAQGEYERLKEIIRARDDASEPPPDWKDQVRRRIAEDTTRRRRQVVPLAAAAAVVLALAVLIWRSTRDVNHLGTPVVYQVASGVLEVNVLSGGMGSRGGGLASPDDVLSLAATSDAPEAELRVYFNDTEIVLHCSDAAPCARRGNTVVAELLMVRRGVYQPVLLVSQTNIPPPRASLDEDSGSALAAGGRITLGQRVEVR